MGKRPTNLKEKKEGHVDELEGKREWGNDQIMISKIKEKRYTAEVIKFYKSYMDHCVCMKVVVAFGSLSSSTIFPEAQLRVSSFHSKRFLPIESFCQSTNIF